jgi:hypothetical protein
MLGLILCEEPDVPPGLNKVGTTGWRYSPAPNVDPGVLKVQVAPSPDK